MKSIIVLFATLVTSLTLLSQDMTKFKLYKPEEKAEQEIARATKEAKEHGKHVLIQIGGNWCIWCARFNDFITRDPKIDSIIHADYVVYHMNYSKENFNAKPLAKYGYPQRFGFPVFLVLNGEGTLLHIQSSWYLEDGMKSYDRDKVIAFLNDWSPAALEPAQYKEQ